MHIFYPEERKYYNMERLWDEGGGAIAIPSKRTQKRKPPGINANTQRRRIRWKKWNSGELSNGLRSPAGI